MFIPKMSISQAPVFKDVEYEKIKVFQENNPEFIENFSAKWESLKDNGSSMVIKSLSLTEFEQNILSEYCKLNSISVGTFIRMAFYFDGAFSSEFLSGLVKQKRITLSFAELDPKGLISPDHDDYNKKSAESTFKNSSVSVKSIPIPVMLLESMNEHIVNNKYPSWTGFVRLALLSYNVLPSIFAGVIHNSLHNMKIDTKVKVTKTNSVTIATSTPQVDHFLWNKLNDFTSKKYKLKASMYFKMLLFKNGIITEDFIGKNSMQNPLIKDKLHSITSAVEGDVDYPGLTISKDDIKKYSEMTPNKNVSVSLSTANAAELRDYLSKEKIKLYGLFDKYIYSKMKK